MTEIVKKEGRVRQISCGCCTNGCICWHHQDTPNGRPPRRCELHPEGTHRMTRTQTFAEAMLECAQAGRLTEEMAREWLEGEDLEKALLLLQAKGGAR